MSWLMPAVRRNDSSKGNTAQMAHHSSAVALTQSSDKLFLDLGFGGAHLAAIGQHLLSARPLGDL